MQAGCTAAILGTMTDFTDHNTEILSASDQDALQRASDLLAAGEVVAFPTETVYGLGANGLDALAVEKIFVAKSRPADNPLILHVSSIQEAIPLWRAEERQIELVRDLARAFWPGPLSLVLPAAARIPSITTGGLDSVAVRAPAHPVAQALLNLCPFPLAAPSANLSGRPSPTQAEHVFATLSGRIAAILDGGRTDLGIESTVLDLCGDRPRLLRPGMVSKEAIEAVAGPVDMAGDVADAPSPGLRHRHYRPKDVQLQLANTMTIEKQWSEDVGLMCRQDTADRLGGRAAPLLVMPEDAEAYAAELYHALYQLEQSDCKNHLIEKVPDRTEWSAIRDRLDRAVGG